jgi:hypothetical protein
MATPSAASAASIVVRIMVLPDFIIGGARVPRNNRQLYVQQTTGPLDISNSSGLIKIIGWQ